MRSIGTPITRYSYLNLSGKTLVFGTGDADTAYEMHTGLPGSVRNAIKTRLGTLLALRDTVSFRQKPVPRSATSLMIGVMMSIQMALSATKHAAVVFPEEMSDDMLYGCALALGSLRKDILIFKASGTSAVMFKDTEVDENSEAVDKMATQLSTTAGAPTKVAH